MSRGIPNFLNKWSPFMIILKKELWHVPFWVKFHDVPLVAYTSDGLSLMAMKISTPLTLDSYTNFMCLESWGRSSYARILIEIDACNDFSDHLVMDVQNLEGSFYMKETIRIEYEWEPPRCSTCLIFGHSPVDCLKASKAAPTRVEVATSSMATTMGMQEEIQSSTPIVDKINVLGKQKCKLMLVNDDSGKG
nr:zinc knuckle CX2CX4HX4C [Tanacetum cinerariifolium]